MKALALLLLCLNPVENIATDRCDVIETNSYYDLEGRLVFDQDIFWDWCPCHERFQVRAWRLVKDQNQLPQYDHARREWRCTWLDGEVVRTVSAPSVRRTWSQHDPEWQERDILPVECRKGLTSPAGR